MKSSKQLIYVAGPTAVGKTALSIALAEYFETEIISCDSRQFYKEMSIGTAIPSAEERSRIPHHFIHHLSIHDPYTVGDFERDAIQLLDQLFKTKDVVIMVGGSGLYADAVLYGMDQFPPLTEEIREMLRNIYQSQGITKLQELLQENDPLYYQQVDKQNPARLLRALEVCFTTKQPYSDFLGKSKPKRAFESKIIVLERPRKELYERINSRVDYMLQQGLLAEVKSLIPYKLLSALHTVGYQELFPYLEGEQSFDESIDLIKRNSRRYAKRQITWLKKYKKAHFLAANTSVENIIAHL